jgi:mannose-6-phosphate isomerase-like protein (cupin superfamily)
MEKVNLSLKFALFHDLWSPKVVAELNGQQVKLAKVKGEFVWHRHAREDELFLVLQGKLTIQFRDRQVELGEGELLVVPAGVEHRPVAEKEAHLLLLEPKGTVNTGDVAEARTVREDAWI